MADEAKKDSQVTIDESKVTKETTEDKLYPGSVEDGNETTEEKETRETKEKEDKEVEEKETKEKEEKETKEKEEKEAKEKKEKEVEAPSITELHDAAIAAVEKWQADPTPENKKLADKAVADAKKLVEDTKKAEIAYDVKLPEGSLLSKESAEEIVAFSREQGFSNEVAQALVDKKNEGAVQNNETVLKNAEELINVAWPNEAAKDKEIGGDDFGKNSELAKRVLQKFAPPEFIKVLDQPSKENPEGKGFGNHPGLLKTFVRIGKIMQDDQLIISKDKGSVKKSTAEVFYGGDKKPEEKNE